MYGDGDMTGDGFPDQEAGRDGSGELHSDNIPTNVYQTNVATGGGAKFMINGEVYQGDSVKFVETEKDGKTYFKVYGRSRVVDINGKTVFWNISYDQELEVVSKGGKTLGTVGNLGYELPNDHVEPLLYMMSGANPVPVQTPSTTPEEKEEGKSGLHPNEDPHRRPVDANPVDDGEEKEDYSFGRDEWEHFQVILTDEDTQAEYKGPIDVQVRTINGKEYIKILGATPQGEGRYGASLHHVMVVTLADGSHTYQPNSDGFIQVPPEEVGVGGLLWFKTGMTYHPPKKSGARRPQPITIVSETTSPLQTNHSGYTFTNSETGTQYNGSHFKVVYYTLSNGNYRIQFTSDKGLVLRDSNIGLEYNTVTKSYAYSGDNPQEFIRERYMTFKTMSDIPPRTSILRAYDYRHTYKPTDIQGVTWIVHDQLGVGNDTDIHVRIFEHNDRTKTVQFYIYDQVGNRAVKVPIEPRAKQGYTSPFTQSTEGYREYTIPASVDSPEDLNIFFRSGMSTKVEVPDSKDDSKDGKDGKDGDGDGDGDGDDDGKGGDDDGGSGDGDGNNNNGSDNKDDSGNNDGDDNDGNESLPPDDDSPIFDPSEDGGKGDSGGNDPISKDNPLVVGFLLIQDDFFENEFDNENEEILGFCMYQDENNSIQEASLHAELPNEQEGSEEASSSGRRCLGENGDTCGRDIVKKSKNPSSFFTPQDDDYSDEISGQPSYGSAFMSGSASPEPQGNKALAVSTQSTDDDDVLTAEPVMGQTKIITEDSEVYDIPQDEKDKLKEFTDFMAETLDNAEAEKLIEETFGMDEMEEEEPLVKEFMDKEVTQADLDNYKWNATFASLAYIDGEARVSKFYGFEYDRQLSTDDIAVYRNPRVNRIMVSFRGTELGDIGKTVSDIANDMMIATNLEKYSLRFRRSYDFVKKLQDENPKQKIVLSSHSLGASISVYCGKRLPNIDVWAYGTGTGLPLVEKLLEPAEATIEELNKQNPFFKIFFDTMFSEQGSKQTNNINHIRYFSDLVSVGRHFKSNTEGEIDVTLKDSKKLFIRAHSVSNFVDNKYRRVTLPIGSRLRKKFNKQKTQRLKYVRF